MIDTLGKAISGTPFQGFCVIPARAGDSLGDIKATKMYEIGFCCRWEGKKFDLCNVRDRIRPPYVLL